MKLLVLLTSALLGFAQAQNVWNQGEKLLHTGTVELGDFYFAFPSNVVISGNKMAVAVDRLDKDGIKDSGVVYTYQNIDGNWVQDAGILEPAERIVDGRFGYSLSMSGDKLVVGSYISGVYTFQWSGSAWIRDVAALSPPELDANDKFGLSVALSGDTLVIGAPADDGVGNSKSGSGAVYTFHWSGSAWIQDATILRPPELDANDQFGWSVALSGDTLAIGALGDDGVGNSKSMSGAVYTFHWSGSAWIQDATILRPPELDVGDQFGRVVVLSGDQQSGYKLAVSASQDDGVDNSKTSTGAVYTFHWDGSAWVRDAAILRADEPDSHQYFGDSVALSGDTLAISATGDSGVDNSKSTSGAVFTFHWSGSAWIQDATILRPPELDAGDNFGSSVAVSGDMLVVGAYGDDDVSSNGGALYTFYPPECTVNTDCTDGKFCVDNVCTFPSCDTNFDCTAFIDAGRLGRCVDSGCVNYATGTCDSVTTCDIQVAKAVANKNAGGQKKVVYSASNTEAIKQAASDLNDQTKASLDDSTRVKTFFSGSFSSTFERALFDNHAGTDDELLAHMKTIACGSVPCTISKDTSRRVLQAQGEVGVVITFDLDDTTYTSLLSQGAFGDAQFITDLSAASGIPTSNITVIATEGTVEVLFVVSQESDGDDPIDQTILDEMNDLSASADSVATSVATSLGLNAGDVTVQSVDLCGERDCNGRGTCDPSTGVCLCTDPNYWGINCETLVSCAPGQNVVKDGVAYCECPYPTSGQRCQTTNACTGCV